MAEILEVFSTGKRQAAINDAVVIFLPGVCLLYFNPHGHVPTEYSHGNVRS